MEVPVSPLVLTKLRVPAIRSRLISRTRLIDLLTSDTLPGIVLICAPAGYGKTTLLVEWTQALKKNGSAVAWFALDSSDDDSIPFSSYFIASLIQCLGPIPELAQVAQLLRSSPEMDMQAVMAAAINAIISCEQECVLILDDYHLIGALEVHSAVAYLLEHLPENLRVAISSRSDPPMPLARWRARGHLFEVRTADLRFTSDETTQFLNEVMRLELSSEGVAALEERTEGWVTGLQLAALSLSSRVDKEQVISSFTGSHRYLVEYLMEEVVSQQPEEVQAFLLSTSILERLCAPLCDALFGSAALNQIQVSEAILKQLEQANLFVVALDDQGFWYRYHHLFRDFLQTRLNKTQPERRNLLHRAACEWLAAHEFLREAANQAFQTHDWEYAAAFVEQYSFTMIIHSEISTIYEWCLAFPEEVMQKHPLLCVLQTLALAYGFRRKNRDRVEARLDQVDTFIAVLEDRETAQGLIDLAAVVRTFLAMVPDPAADPREVLTIAQSMMSVYPEGDAAQFSGLLLTGYANMALYNIQAAVHAFETARRIAQQEKLYFGIVESTFHLAHIAYNQGQLQRAVEICRQAKADISAVLANPEQELPALGGLDIWPGIVFMEQDRLAEAEQYLRHGLDLMGGGMNPYYIMTACVALFRLCEIQGRAAEAMKFLDRLEAAWPDVTFCTRGLRVSHPLRTAPNNSDKLAEMYAWCKDFSSIIDERVPLTGVGPIGAAEVYYLAHRSWVCAHLAAGKPNIVRPYLARQLELASSQGLTSRVIELSLLEAQAWRAEGEDQRALAAIERALATAEPAGYLRIFDQGTSLTRLLLEAAQHGIYKGYIERIAAVTGIPEAAHLEQDISTTRSIQTPYGENLSERELEVLLLISQGATNQEIANQLFITVGTVKSHINHILVKLNAHNRTEALRRARESGYKVA